MNRISSLDILRGMTICGMILVNNPGGGEENAFSPLLHAEWIGLTPTDLVFPFFMFIMGITTYLSLRHYNFRWSSGCALKIFRRGLLLWLIGLAITWSIMFTRGMINPDNASLPLLERMLVSANVFDHIRLLGVLPRLGICYILAAAIALSVKHRYIPYLIAAICIAYYAILELFNGYAHDATNIIAVVDDIILGHSHVYRAESPDPEGLLSTLPSVAHVLTGFCVGKLLTLKGTLNDTVSRLFIAGTLMMLCGALLAYLCPISKKLWTPTFILTTCGMATSLLALLTWVVDIRQFKVAKVTTFFNVFGINPLMLFIISDVLLIPCSILPLVGGTTIQHATYSSLSNIMSPQMSSLLWAIIYILINWVIGYALYKKKIIVKL